MSRYQTINLKNDSFIALKQYTLKRKFELNDAQFNYSEAIKELTEEVKKE